MAPTPPTEAEPNGGFKDQPYTRATTMAKTISDTFALDQWGNRMVAKGLTLRPDLRALVAATPFTDRDTLNKACEDAKSAAGSKVSANLGTARHALTELADRGQPLPPLEPAEQADLSAYQAALAEAGIKVLPQYIERTVIRPDFGVAGTYDRIVEMPDGTRRIADLKTGADLSYGWSEIAIQEAIYQGAEWMYDYVTGTWERMPETDPAMGLVMHLPVGQGVCTLYHVNLAAGRAGLALAHQVRAHRKLKNLAVPFGTATVAITGQAEVGTPTVAPATPLQRVRAATNKATLAALWEELNPQGLWTGELMAAAQDQLTKFATT